MPVLTFPVLGVVLEGDVSQVQDGRHGGVDGQTLFVTQTDRG